MRIGVVLYPHFFRQRKTRNHDEPQPFIQLHGLPIPFAIHFGYGSDLRFDVLLATRRRTLCRASWKMRDDYFLTEIEIFWKFIQRSDFRPALDHQPSITVHQLFKLGANLVGRQERHVSFNYLLPFENDF